MFKYVNSNLRTTCKESTICISENGKIKSVSWTMFNNIFHMNSVSGDLYRFTCIGKSDTCNKVCNKIEKVYVSVY